MRARGLLCAAAAAVLLIACGSAPVSPPAGARRLAPSGASAPAGSKATDGTCTWQPVATGTGASIKDVGTPPATVRTASAATMTLRTNLGVIEIAMTPRTAPCAVASFAYLAGKQFFDGSPCHRLVVTGLSVLQCGDPSGTGTGGPAYQYAEENLGGGTPYRRGVVAVARTADPGTSGSQFFINFADNLELSADYTPFGTVSKGMDIVDQVAAGGVSTGAADGPPKIAITLQTVTVTYA